MTLREYAISISPIPLGYQTIEAILLGLELSSTESISPELLKSSKGLSLKALILEQAVISPNVSEGGISYSLSDGARIALRKEAERLKMQADQLALAEGEDAGLMSYGYQGDEL